MPTHGALFDRKGYILLPMGLHDRAGSWPDLVADHEAVYTVNLENPVERQFFPKMILNGVREVYNHDLSTNLVRRTNMGKLRLVHCAKFIG